MKSNLKITIPLVEAIREVMLTRQQAQDLTKKVLMDVTVAVGKAWKDAARRELHSTRASYTRSIYLVEQGRLKNALILGGSFNNMLENGVSAFDLKEGMSNSSKKKISSKGTWYLHVPFRFATPGSLGESSVFAGVMPKSVHKAMQTSGKTKSGKDAGLKAINIPSDLKAPKSRAAFTDVATKTQYDEYKHKASIYQGITKSSKFYEEATQAQYNSFRTVSENSDKNSWIHPGLKVGNFAEKGIKSIDIGLIADNSIDSYLASL